MGGSWIPHGMGAWNSPRDGAVGELSPPKPVTPTRKCPCQPQECQSRKGKGDGNPNDSLWKHKDHPPRPGFWAWMGGCCPLELLPSIWIPPCSCPELSSDPGVTAAPETGNHFPFNLLVFFFPWLGTTIPSRGWVGKAGAPLPWEVFPAVGQHRDGWEGIFLFSRRNSHLSKVSSCPG